MSTDEFAAPPIDDAPATGPTLIIDQDGRWSDIYHLQPGRDVTIGRSRDCQIVVRTDGVSRRHSRVFESGDGRWSIEDLGSRNGTVVDGRMIQRPTRMRPGQTVSIAGFTIRFDDGSGDGGNAELADVAQGSVGETQATTALDPDTIRHRMGRRSGWLTGRSNNDLGGNHGDNLRDNLGGNDRKRAELLRYTFAAAAIGDWTELVRSAIDFLRGADRCDADRRVAFIPAGTKTSAKVIGWQHDDAVVLAQQHGSQNDQAVLARNVRWLHRSDDAPDDAPAEDVIVAPVQSSVASPSRLLGHLIVDGRDLRGDDLRQVVAVAEVLSLRHGVLRKTQRLTRSLQRARQQVLWLRETLGDRLEMIGRSPALAALIEDVRKVASAPSTVLIAGRSGVGKKLIATAIHYAGDRAEGPLVTIHCGGDSFSPDRMSAAHRGTLLLDRVDRLSGEDQSRWSQFLRDRSVRRVGTVDGDQTIAVDVRVIATTQQDLRSMVDAGQFRDDLYDSLAVVPIEVPPLRRRGDDVLLLAKHFVRQFARQIGRPMDSIDPAAAAMLQQYDWPGNIRELRNTIERAVVLSDRSVLSVEDLWLPGLDRDAGSSGDEVETTLAELENRHIDRVLSHTGNNKTAAAKILGIQRSTLDRKLKRRGRLGRG